MLEPNEPIAGDDLITMAHGAGGKLSQRLMEEDILPAFTNPLLDVLHDGAILGINGERLAFSTDSYVVEPLFFNGGNIGKLAVSGTVNDLAMTGAVPRYLSASFILEEGFSRNKLRTIARTMDDVANEAGVQIVTGDTKVVERGRAGGIYINTAGIGEIIAGINISPKNVKPNMKIILSGFIGDHAAVILAARHGLEIAGNIKTDSAPLNGMVQSMLTAVPSIAMLRDPTRGGVSAVLNEIATAADCGIVIDEETIPVREEAQGIIDLLGLDALTLANEGKCIAFVPTADAGKLLAVMRAHPYGKDARIIGETTADNPRQVALATLIGGLRLIDMPLGEIVPRIC